MRWFFLPILILIAALAVGVWRGIIPVPPEWNPWAPLDLRAEENSLTWFKLKRLARDPRLCTAALSTADMRYTFVPNGAIGGKCPLENVIRVQDLGALRVSGSFLSSCPLAAALAFFVRHSLQPSAQEHFGKKVVEIEHLGSYACRNVYSRPQGRLSQHASANALDISGFRLADGTRVVIGRDWNGSDEKSRFLHDVAKKACRSFSLVLGPDYNAAHHNHFHLDMSPYWYCP
ncbi:extensin family protein [Parvibaculum sp.]|uniref:extensin-like domain-containing protein n=1 Tax=Parvibaculum sp. TaxID=2024848 RepID=UPI002B5CAEF9|nr:extensin family protein [Parvibaculum sp.]HUD51105.1 extensin family protein [Parvibaculum sp.]